MRRVRRLILFGVLGLATLAGVPIALFLAWATVDQAISGQDPVLYGFGAVLVGGCVLGAWTFVRRGEVGFGLLCAVVPLLAVPAMGYLAVVALNRLASV